MPDRSAAGSGSAARPNGLWILLGLGLVLLACAWLRAPTLRDPFLADDYLFLDQLRGGSILSAWSVRDPLRNYWRPLSRQGYFGLVSLAGESPVVAHALNLALMLGIVVLVFVLARRLSGARAAVVAASIVALHEAADVPVLWASGSQDLLAVVGALGALVLAARGRMRSAAVAFLAALLSKETVIVTPAIALLMRREPGESWRASLLRIRPLWVVLLAWFPVWALMMRGGEHQGLSFGLDSVPAAIAHLPQAFFGVQWDRSAPFSLTSLAPMLVPMLLVLTAVARMSRVHDQAAHGARPGADGVRLGLAWALLASLPVAIVAHVWCSYYYLFATCGLALVVGTAIARAPAPVAMATVLLLAWGSEHARRLESFATEPHRWGTQSHLSRFYFDRAMRWVARYLEDLRAQLPSVPPRSTLYFAGTPAFASWQSGDGALMRWVYRDATIRSYYFGDFSLQRAREGEVFVFTARADSLVRERDTVAGLMLIASGQILGEKFAVADDAITRALELDPARKSLHYWRAWIRLATGDSSSLTRELEAGGCTPRATPNPGHGSALRNLAVGDRQGAMNTAGDGVAGYALDPGAHAELADVLIAVAPQAAGLGVEALAVRLLAPRDPEAWRRWAHVQVTNDHAAEAYASLRRYFELAGPAASANREDRALLERLRAALPGGELAQRELRTRPRE